MLDERHMYMLVLYAYANVSAMMLGREDYHVTTLIDGDTAELRIRVLDEKTRVTISDFRVIKGRRFRKKGQLRRIENVLSRLRKEGVL